MANDTTLNEIITYKLIIDDGEPINVGTKTTYDTSLLNPGEHTVTVIAECAHGYTNQDSTKIVIPEPCHINDTNIEYTMNNKTYKITWDISNAYAAAENMTYCISVDQADAIPTDATYYDFSNDQPGDHTIQLNILQCSHDNSTELEQFNYTLIDPIKDVKPLLQTQVTSLENSKIFKYNINLPEVTENTNYAHDVFKHYLILDDNVTIELPNLSGIYQFYDLSRGLHKVNLITKCEHNQTKYIQNTFNITGELYTGYNYALQTETGLSDYSIYIFNANGKTYFKERHGYAYETLKLCTIVDNIIMTSSWSTLIYDNMYEIIDDNTIKAFYYDQNGQKIYTDTYIKNGTTRTIYNNNVYLALNNHEFNGPNLKYINATADNVTIIINKTDNVSSTALPGVDVTFIPAFLIHNVTNDRIEYFIEPSNPNEGQIIETDDTITYIINRQYDETTNNWDRLAVVWYLFDPTLQGSCYECCYSNNVVELPWVETIERNPGNIDDMDNYGYGRISHTDFTTSDQSNSNLK